MHSSAATDGVVTSEVVAPVETSPQDESCEIPLMGNAAPTIDATSDAMDGVAFAAVAQGDAVRG